MKNLNLLPQQRLHNLRREMVILAATRFLTSVLIGLIILTGVGGAIGSGLWVLSFVGSSAAEAGLSVQLTEYRRARAAIDQRNLLLTSAADIGQGRIVWSDVLATWLLAVPPGATVDRVEAISDDEPRLSFYGTAPTRASLVVFEEHLRQLSWAKEVDAPRENLLRQVNPNYTFTVHLDLAKISPNQPNGETTPQP
jgi:hypothetical protein